MPLSVVANAVPPEETSCTPPLSIVVWLAVPPPLMSCSPPPATVALTVVPKTRWACPRVSDGFGGRAPGPDGGDTHQLDGGGKRACGSEMDILRGDHIERDSACSSPPNRDGACRAVPPSVALSTPVPDVKATVSPGPKVAQSNVMLSPAARPLITAAGADVVASSSTPPEPAQSDACAQGSGLAKHQRAAADDTADNRAAEQRVQESAGADDRGDGAGQVLGDLGAAAQNRRRACGGDAVSVADDLQAAADRVVADGDAGGGNILLATAVDDRVAGGAGAGLEISYCLQAAAVDRGVDGRARAREHAADRNTAGDRLIAAIVDRRVDGRAASYEKPTEPLSAAAVDGRADRHACRLKSREGRRC